jgi:hypothetical protein
LAKDPKRLILGTASSALRYAGAAFALRKLAEREGFEPPVGVSQEVDGYEPDVVFEALPSPIASPNSEKPCPGLAKVVFAWPGLRPDLRAAIVAIVEASE